MSTHRRLLATGRTATAALAAAVVLGLAMAALAVAQALLLARAISAAFLGGADVSALGGVLAALALVLAGRALLGWGAEVAAQRVSGAVKADLRVRLLAAAVARGPSLAAERSTAGVALLATRGLDALDGYFGRYLPQVALAIIVPVAVVGCLALVDGVAALTVALTVPLIPVFMVLIGRMSAARRDRRWAMLGRLATRFSDTLAGLPTLRAFGRADAQVAILRRITDAYRSATLDTLRVAFLSAMTLELLATVSVALVAVGIALRLMSGDLALETGLFALVLAPEAYLPLRRLGAEFHASEEGVAAARDAFAVLDGGTASTPASGAVPAKLAGIAVEGLSVEQPGRLVLAPADVSLVVRAGEVVAVTGASGAGKSTLIAAIIGFTRPTAGRAWALAADGDRVDLASVDPVAWRACVAWVPQVPYLFPGTVADNVRLGSPGATDAEVADALARVGLAGADAGMDIILGERGRGLSGGQRRRLGVARALVRRSPVLLLDEPTAGLDTAAETQVMTAIRAEASRGAAVLLVAHRPGAVADADRIVEVGWAAVDPASPPALEGAS